MRAAFLLERAAASAVAILFASGAARASDAVSLRPAESVRRQITAGEEHRFAVTIAAGECASIVVEQHGVALAVEASAADGRSLGDVQDEIRSEGRQRIDIAADEAGVFVVTIKTAAIGTVAGEYAVRMAEPRAATESDRQMQQSRILRSRARRLSSRGHYAEARPLLDEALAIAEAARGFEDTEAALVAFDLASNALEAQENARSRALYERAIHTLGSAWGAAHPYPVMARSRLALLDERAGQRQKAETGVREVLPLLERALGRDHPWYLQTQVTLANQRLNAGDLQQAEEILRASIATLDRTAQTGTLLEATLVNNLADVLRAKGDIAGAGPLFRRSLALADSLFDTDTLFVATALQNLGIIARERKDYSAAIASYARAFAMRRRLLGEDHPSLAGVLTNLANVYRATGDDTRALEMHFRALRMWEKSVGPFGRETLLAVGNIARTYAGMGDIDNALAFQRRADAILETQMGLYLASGSERQKLAFARNQAERTDRTISLHLKQAPDNPDAAALAALVLLQRKGRVQDAMTDLYASVRQRVSTVEERALMDQLKETTASLSRIAFDGPGGGGRDVRESVAEIESRKEQLEATLSERSADFRATIQPVTLEAVQEALPGDAVLLEFAVFRPFDPEAERNDEAYGPPHYAAYVIGKHDVPAGVDLGAAEDIDRLIVRMRAALRDPANTDVAGRARALDERIMQPLRASLNGATRLLISPDGGLNLVPFETLVDGHGRYLIERYAATYLSSGRDLLRRQAPRAMAGKPVIVADPLFGEPAAVAVASAPLKLADARRSITAGSDVSTLYFAPLSGSAVEGRAIKALFPEAMLLTGSGASKTALEHIVAPRLLHIASHGFFLDDGGGAGGDQVVAQNPLLRSGLALAGANLRGSAHGDGILTALEAAGLDLWGTSLVTLSACDTGVGEVRNGEGVYGLRRAFMLAGAETLVMSLWPVTDAVARDTMVAYYARLRRGIGRGDALRQAKLALLRRPGMRHPYYWGGFIQSGDWTRLRAAR